MALSEYLRRYLHNGCSRNRQWVITHENISYYNRVTNEWELIAVQAKTSEVHSLSKLFEDLFSENTLYIRKYKESLYYISQYMILNRFKTPIFYRHRSQGEMVLYIDYSVFESKGPVEKLLAKSVKSATNDYTSVMITDLQKHIQIRRHIPFTPDNELSYILKYGAEQESSKCNQESNR